MKYLLDTNICVYLINRKDLVLMKRMRQVPIEWVCVSTMVVAELLFGAAKSEYPIKNRQAIADFLANLTILDFDAEAAAHYGDIRATLERKGTPIGLFDLLIAAHARSRGLTLVTNNEREFMRVDGLKIENWIN